MHSLESNKYGGGELSDRLAGSCGGGGYRRIRKGLEPLPIYSLAIPIIQFGITKGIGFICILVPLGISWYNESLGDLGLIKKGSGALFPEILIFHIFSFLV